MLKHVDYHRIEDDYRTFLYSDNVVSVNYKMLCIFITPDGHTNIPNLAELWDGMKEDFDYCASNWNEMLKANYGLDIDMVYCSEWNVYQFGSRNDMNRFVESFIQPTTVFISTRNDLKRVDVGVQYVDDASNAVEIV